MNKQQEREMIWLRDNLDLNEEQSKKLLKSYTLIDLLNKEPDQLENILKNLVAEESGEKESEQTKKSQKASSPQKTSKPTKRAEAESPLPPETEDMGGNESTDTIMEKE